LSYPGLIYLMAVWKDQMLTRDELLDQQFRPRPTGAACAGFWRPGSNGRGPVWDESGNNNHGTITGAIPTNDFLPRIFQRAS
jgi:hypothetical protein